MEIIYSSGGIMSKIRNLFLWIFTPIQKILQRSGKQEPLISFDQAEKCIDLIKPGDILLSYESGRPTSALIRGFYDHAAIITSKYTVMEAVGDRFIFLEKYSLWKRIKFYIKKFFIRKQTLKTKNIGGVRQTGLAEWLYKKDSVCVIRPIYNQDKIKLNVNLLASKAVFFYEGLGYDYSFSFGNETVYCSELVYASYLKYDPKFMNHIPYNEEILPMDYYSACINSGREEMFFQIIYEARN